MKVDQAPEDRKIRILDKHLTLKATDFIDILQNVHIRPQPLTNKVATHYRSRSSLLPNYYPKQMSSEIFAGKDASQKQ